jgi:hypothetical protein
MNSKTPGKSCLMTFSVTSVFSVVQIIKILLMKCHWSME